MGRWGTGAVQNRETEEERAADEEGSRRIQRIWVKSEGRRRRGDR